MQWSDINFAPSAKTLRQFAALWILFFSGVGAWQETAHGRHALAVSCMVVAFSIGTAGLLRPQLMRPIWVGWSIAAFPIGWTVSHAILAVFFYGVLTPTAIVFRCIGRDALRRRRTSQLTSYWQEKKPPANLASYFRPF